MLMFIKVFFGAQMFSFLWNDSLVIKKYIVNNKYRKKALSLYNKHVDPLTYKGDTGIKHRIYLITRKIQYIRKYRKFKW